jgi:hypothetical protein
MAALCSICSAEVSSAAGQLKSGDAPINWKVNQTNSIFFLIRLRILRGIDALLMAVEKHCGIEIASRLITNELMPQTLNSLSQVVTDEVSDHPFSFLRTVVSSDV